MYKYPDKEIFDYVTSHLGILSKGYSVNDFDKTDWVLCSDGLELDVETISNPPSNQSTRERFTSKKKIMDKLEELVMSLRKK